MRRSFSKTCSSVHRFSKEAVQTPFSTRSRQQFDADFNHKLWWKVHGDSVRYLLEYGIGGTGVSGDLSSRQPIPLRNRFEQTYGLNVIYQDLFIDCPPCRDTLKLSFELIHRFWEVKITEWNPPSLVATTSSRKMECDNNGNKNTVTPHQESNYFQKKNERILRISYTAIQRPRLFFVPSAFYEKMVKLLEFQYEGWIDLYVRPELTPGCDDDNEDFDYCDSSNWKVYRHDDRFRVYPPKLIWYYNKDIFEHLNGENAIDILSVIERTAFVSTIFQGFRSLHGKIVHHFARKKIESTRR